MKQPKRCIRLACATILQSFFIVEKTDTNSHWSFLFRYSKSNFSDQWFTIFSLYTLKKCRISFRFRFIRYGIDNCHNILSETGKVFYYYHITLFNMEQFIFYNVWSWYIHQTSIHIYCKRDVFKINGKFHGIKLNNRKNIKWMMYAIYKNKIKIN